MKLIVCVFLLLIGGGQAQEVRVAVAANLRDTFEQLARFYNNTNPVVKITPSYGASGAFTQQIASGAPFDIFMSADLGFPQDLQRRGLVEEGSLRIYAVGKLILFVPSRVGVKATSMKILTDPRITRLIIANPETAPYGKAAVQAMTKAGVYEQVRSKIAFGQNIAQAAQLTLAAGDAGFINLSAIYGPDLKQQGTWLIIPQNFHDPIEQGMVMVKGRMRPEVQAFFRFLTSSEANRIYRAWGYDLPRGSP